MGLPRRSIVILLSCLLLCSCGGGGGGDGGGGGGGTPPPSGLSYPTPPAFIVGHAISSLAPTVTGTVSAYSVSPALPAGLNLDTSTGVIAGTPSAITSAASYTVKASNSGGSTTAKITVTVNDAPPVISYGGIRFAFTAQVPVHLSSANSGGAVVTWSISPALPVGLTFSTTDGSIAGTSTAAVAEASYVVTAGNSGGQSSVRLTLAVQSVLFNLGHDTGIARIRLGNSRVLSMDGSSWVLWDAGTAAFIAGGATECFPGPSHLFPCNAPKVDIAGSIIVIERKGALELRSASDGSLIATLTDPGLKWWLLATDGSYLCANSANGLTVWSPTGAVVVSHTGDYSGALAFAAPGAVRVGLGPAGASVIETISVPSGSSSTGPAFQGQFNSWFQDGGQFFTNVGSTVWVYSADGTQEDLRALPTIAGLTGQGSWFWTYPGPTVDTLTVYKVGASASPAGTFSVGGGDPRPTSSGMTIGALEDHLGGSPLTVTGVVHIIDLSGPNPVMADYTTPAYANSAYAAISSSQWLVGNNNGTLLDGASLGGALRYFGYGHASSIAGSAKQVAVATAVGKTLFFNVVTNALEGTIDSPGSQLALSADGSVLVAASTNFVGATVQVYSLPGGTLTHSWPPATLQSFALSESGTVLGQVLGPCPACIATRQVTATNGGAAIWSATDNAQPIRLSPDGTLIAASSAHDATATTNIYRNGVLVTAIPGWATCWLDNSHLLIYSFASGTSAIFDPSGLKLSTPAPHDFEDPFQVVGPDSIYDLYRNTIFSVSTGAPTWSTVTPSTGVGAVAGSNVVFVSGNQVLSQPF